MSVNDLESEILNDELSTSENDINDEIKDQDIFQTKQDLVPIKRPEEELEEIYRNLIEGALYAAGRSLTVEELSTKLNIPQKKTQQFLDELIELYSNRKSALIIANIGDKYQMQIKTEYSEKISQFAQGGAISEKYLRTLTIIALKQPILKYPKAFLKIIIRFITSLFVVFDYH